MSIRTTRRDLLKSAGAFAFAPMAGRLFASDEKDSACGGKEDGHE